MDDVIFYILMTRHVFVCNSRMAEWLHLDLRSLQNINRKSYLRLTNVGARVPITRYAYRVVQQIGTVFCTPNFIKYLPCTKLFHCENQYKIYNNTIAPLPCEMSSFLKATSEKKTTSVTEHFKKLTTEDNTFSVSVNLK